MKANRRKIYAFDASMTEQELDLLLDSVRRNLEFGIHDEGDRAVLQSMETTLSFLKGGKA